jgi:D-glycero-alpha-D-manno-heptose-7-phosphate kinase
MIVSKTPLRISFCGGGTDLPSYYEREGGCVLSWTIDKYVYVFANHKFDEKIRVAYSKVEIVDDVNVLENELVKHALITTDTTRAIEVATISDIPAGTGLGSSSAFTVGLLKSLCSLKGIPYTPFQLAEWACQIELEYCKAPIGKQDQYSCAVGGLNRFTFTPSGEVITRKVHVCDEFKQDLENHLVMVWTGTTRVANQILKEQSINNNDEHLRLLKEYTKTLSNQFVQEYHVHLGHILHETWKLKKKFASQISNPELDLIYDRAIEAGAEGGKLLGAGGGGFFLFYVKPEKRGKLLTMFPNHVQFSFTDSSPQAWSY